MKKILFIATLLASWLPFSTAHADNVAKIGSTEYGTLAEAVSAAAAGQTVDITVAGTYSLPNLPQNITIQGDVDGVVFNCIGAYGTSVASVPNGATFKNLTFNFGKEKYHGFQHAGLINMDACTLNGIFFSYGDMNFTNCQFVQNNADYHMWCYDGDVTYTNCTFTNNATGKFLNVYNEGSGAHKVTVIGCKFINNSTSASKAAINVKATCGSTMLDYTVSISGDCTTEGAFPAPGVSDNAEHTDVISPLVQVDDRTGSAASENISVELDNVVVYDSGAEVEVVEINNVAELKAFRDAVNNSTSYAGKIVRLMADLDLSREANWQPIGDVKAYPGHSLKGTFDGNGHTISNLTVDDQTVNWGCAGLFGSVSNGSIVNLTLRNVNILSHHYAAGIVAYKGDNKVEAKILNCHVIGGTITTTPELLASGSYDNGDKAGGIVGFCTTGTTIKDCTVEGLTVRAYRDLAGICGYASGEVSDCTVTDVTVIQDNTNGYKDEDVSTTACEVVGGRSANAATTNAANTVENVTIEHVNPVAKIGSNSYATLEAAFAAATDGQTITLLANCAGNGIKVPQGKFTTGLTVNFAGFTYTVDGETVGSTGTETNGFQLLKDNNITFKGGTITSTKAKILIQNYSNLTLEGMTLTLNNSGYTSAYTLSNNNGNIVIDGSTINANTGGGFAFDVCRYSSYTSVNVEVKGASVINGNIEISASGSDAKDGFGLKLTSGTLNGDIVIDPTAAAAMEQTPEKATVTKANDFAADAPEGYTWQSNGDGTYSVKPIAYVAQIGTTKYETLQEALDAAEAEDTPNIVINLLNDATLDITAWDGAKNPLSIGTANTLSITINGNGHTLTFNQKNSDWNNVATMNDAQTKLILNNMNITSSGYNDGPWNRHDINFNCAVEMNNVTSDKALAFKNDATLNDVTVNDASGDIYAIWVSPRTEGGQTISINGLDVTCGRGIKIDDQYVDDPVSTTLEIEDATFTTSKKSAILVKTAGGADITVGEDVDITNVAADPNNVVWVDEDRADEYYNVTVTGTGASLIPEGGEVSYVASLVRGDQTRGYYATFAAAYNSTDFEEGDTYKLLKTTTEAVEVAKALTIVKNGCTAANLTAAEGFKKTETDEAITFVAVDPVCEIAGVQYYTLAEAVAAVPTDGTQTTITMIDNETVNVSGYAIVIAKNQNVVLDLNGYQVVGACEDANTSALIRNLGTLTIKDSSDTQADGSGNGKLIAGADPTWTWDGSDNYAGSYASNVIRNEGTLVVNSGLLSNVSSGSAAYAIDNYGSGSVTINGGKIDAAKASAIRMFYVNGGSITVNDGIVGHYTDDNDCTFMGVQVMSGSNVNVSVTGGTIIGTYAFYATNTGGSINISGGTFDGYVGFGSACTNDISITDGRFLEWCGTWGSHAGFISGGVFAQPVDETYCADGYIPTDNGDGTYGVKLGTYVAKIGDDKKFETLEAAFAAAEDGQTITLLADCAGNGIQVAQGKYTTGLTVDFAGFTYTINGATVGSTGTKTQAFQLLKGNTITFKNGTIVADNVDVKMMIQNYSNLTLESMVLDATKGTNSIGYVVSTNNGSTTISNTTITAKAEGVAFDVCTGWGGYTSNNVEVTGTSKINGDVEVSFYGDGTAPVLTLTSGTLIGDIVMEKGADKATVTQADTFNAEAPDGYQWKSNGDGTSTLAPNVIVGSTGFATFSSTKALDFTDVENIYAYIAVVEDGKVTYKRIRKVPAGTGLLLRNPDKEAADKSAKAYVPTLSGDADSTEGNAFVAVSETITSLASTEGNMINYILNNGSNGIGFYRANGKKVAAGKAYLAIPTSIHDVKALVFDEDDATGIAEVESFDEGTQATYNLAGQRVPARSAQKGIYIVNGKKIIK